MFGSVLAAMDSLVFTPLSEPNPEYSERAHGAALSRPRFYQNRGHFWKQMEEEKTKPFSLDERLAQAQIAWKPANQALSTKIRSKFGCHNTFNRLGHQIVLASPSI
jgi:hypothetical protein